jgi:hypothetical protein
MGDMSAPRPTPTALRGYIVDTKWSLIAHCKIIDSHQRIKKRGTTRSHRHFKEHQGTLERFAGRSAATLNPPSRAWTEQVEALRQPA